MRRTIALLAIAILTATSGCGGTMSKDARTAVVLSGIALTIGGAVAYGTAEHESPDSSDPGSHIFEFDDGDQQETIGLVAIIAGVVVFIVGVAADEPPSQPTVAPPVAPSASPTAAALTLP